MLTTSANLEEPLLHSKPHDSTGQQGSPNGATGGATSPDPSCGYAASGQLLEVEEDEEDAAMSKVSYTSAYSTATYIHAVDEAAVRKRPLLSSATLPGVAGTGAMQQMCCKLS